MPTPSSAIIQLVSTFAVAFTAPTFANALVLVYGSILAPGRRTVTAALRAMGLANDRHFGTYHRVLSRAEWSPLLLSQLLFALIIQRCLVTDAPLVLVIDEHLERRQGRKIAYKGHFHDAVRSTATHVVTSLGLRWICLMILVPVPWSTRPGALPFMTVLALAPKTSAKLKKRHRTRAQWAGGMIACVRRWQPEREIILVGDSSYAATPLVKRCQGFRRPVKLVSRLRLDAVLHDFPTPPPKGKRGRKPKKGAVQPTLAERVSDPRSPWESLTVPWYGGDERQIEVISGLSLWYRRGSDPVPVHWVLVRSPEQRFKPVAFFCSAPTVAARQIILWYTARWNIEVTFEELRAHLGFETQRHWSDRAIQRTTPALFGLFSLVVLMAQVLHPQVLPRRQAAWYPKPEATFVDALAAVRRHLWGLANSSISPHDPNLLLFPRPTLLALLDLACYST